MSTVQKYYNARKAALALLPQDQDVVYISSIGDDSIHHKDSVVLPVDRFTAASMLAKGSHKLANDEEIIKYDKAEEKAKHETESKRSLPITAETIAQIAIAANRPVSKPTKKDGEN